MYLKSLEMIGFKSFADKTRLEFEQGMTAIVGPNGCGKSNVSDAIKWVIGEQSAKALRASKMEDCIFNGTDSRKPLGMAEVSITFTDCEASLGTEYHEVTISRRVFRSGEGQYFLNKTPCRLKDIQRLFMDTGVGTVSYSLMEQGRIDRVLSSHPEDRREIFEEASGITKFKSDKNEAMRKLEHTESNLLRLADVIREVKRQIGSLQRQAGKARTYKALREELRKLDMFAVKRHLAALDSNIEQLNAKIESYAISLKFSQSEVTELETGNSALRETILNTEREVGAMLEAGAQAKNKLDNTREMIRQNGQRIAEYRQWSERDSREISETLRQISEKKVTLEALVNRIEIARTSVSDAEKEVKESSEHYSKHQRQIDEARSQIHRLREEAVELESATFKLQNQLMEIEARERSSVLQKERLAAEKTQMARTMTSFLQKQAEMEQELARMGKMVTAAQQLLEETREGRTEKLAVLSSLQEKRSGLHSQLASKETQLEMLSNEENAGNDLPAGARAILENPDKFGSDTTRVLGALSSNIDVDPAYRVAAEVALRSWLDGIVVTDSANALQILKSLESGKAGSIRMLSPAAAEAERPALSSGEEWLLDHVRCVQGSAKSLLALLANVVVVTAAKDIPAAVPANLAYVTLNGMIVRGNGCMELWAPDSRSTAPLSRKHLIDETRTEIDSFRRQMQETELSIHTTRTEIEMIEKDIRQKQADLDSSRRSLAQKEGEAQMVVKEARDAKEHLETVSWELENLQNQNAGKTSERAEITANIEKIQAQRQKIGTDIKALTEELQHMEQRHSELQTEMTDRRISCSSLQQQFQTLQNQRTDLSARVGELESSIKGRSDSIQTHEASIQRLTAEIKDAEGRLSSLEEAVTNNTIRAETLKRNRERQSAELNELERMLSQKRMALDERRSAKSSQEIQLAQCNMRRQNTVDRITSEYGITVDQIQQEPEPEWTDTPAPSLDAAETMVAELRTKLEAMGPVNLVAIEEYNELEERHKFLTTQEQDLINAKQQLMDMIKKINTTTSDLFRETFDKININFQNMFEKLFNGGSAKLVLVNEEDILECGIEIIARPPGKRLQNISLMSGGERTMTAVALLFSIYMIKPSPFCLLDELDAALDESNIGRFVNVLRDFIKQSQFVVITHNRQTISAAHVLYGVTMPEKGVSKIVSMKFADYKGNEKMRTPAASEPVAAETPQQPAN